MDALVSDTHSRKNGSRRRQIAAWRRGPWSKLAEKRGCRGRSRAGTLAGDGGRRQARVVSGRRQTPPDPKDLRQSRSELRSGPSLDSRLPMAKPLQTPVSSLPINPHPTNPPWPIPTPNAHHHTMATYYYPAQTAHSTRQRAYSLSYHHPPSSAYPAHAAYPASYSSRHSSPHHHSTAYAQQPVYHAAPQYLTPTYQYGDSSRHRSHHGHARTGSGGAVYYTSSAPTHHHSSSHSSPARRAGTVHYATSRRSSSSHHHSRPKRSQSVPRQTVRIAADSGSRLRRVSTPPFLSMPLSWLTKHIQSESRPRETVTHNTSHSHHRRGSSSSDLPLGERIRRMFGFGSSSQGYRYGDPHRGPTYMDARTGHPVDWRGRPVYRV